MGRLGGEAKAFVRSVLGRLLADADFRLSVYGHLPPDAPSQGRATVVLQRLHAIVEE